MNKDIDFDFLCSALTEKNPFIQTEEVISWLQKKNNEVEVIVERIHFSKLKDWYFSDNVTKLVHGSGKFFSIEGIRVKTNQGF